MNSPASRIVKSTCFRLMNSCLAGTLPMMLRHVTARNELLRLNDTNTGIDSTHECCRRDVFTAFYADGNTVITGIGPIASQPMRQRPPSWYHGIRHQPPMMSASCSCLPGLRKAFQIGVGSKTRRGMKTTTDGQPTTVISHLRRIAAASPDRHEVLRCAVALPCGPSSLGRGLALWHDRSQLIGVTAACDSTAPFHQRP